MYKNIPKDKIDYLGGVKTDNVYFNIQGQLIKDGSAPTNKNGVNYLTRERQADSAVTNASGFYYSPGKMYTITDLENMLRIYISSDFGNFPLTGSPDKIELPDKFNINGGQPLITYNKIMAPIEFLYSTMGLVGTGEEMKNLMMAALSPTPTDDTILVRYLVSMQMPDVNGIGEPINGGALTPLFEFTDSTVKKKYQEILNKATTDIERKQAMITTMRELNLKVAFEPVSWAVPVVLSSKLQPIIPNKWGYIWTSDRTVYGTPTNVVSYVLSELNKTYRSKYPESGMPPYSEYGNYLTWLRNNDVRLGWQWNLTTEAYRTAKDIPEFNMVAYDPNKIGGSDLASLGASLFTLGFGVMYFGVDVEQINSTPTWDNITYPESSYQPGPAPDKSSITTEGEDYKKTTYPDGTIKDKNFNIVKFYATKDSSGNYNYIENHVRNQTIHTITLNDELGYKVDDYFTSTDYREPSSSTDSYDDYKDELPIGAITGTSAGQIQIPSTSNENTLYMRLVSEDDTPIDGEVEIKIPLYENEVSKQTSLSSVLPSADLKITNTLPSVPKDINGSRYKEQYRSEGSQGWKAWYNYHNPSLTGADSDLIAKPAPFETQYTGLASGTRTVKRASITSVPQSFNSKFSIWRGMDRPTLAAYKPEDSNNTKSELKILGLPEGTTPQSSRGKTGTQTDISGIIQKSFNSQFEVDDSNSKYNIETEYRIRDGYWGGKNGNRWKWYPWTSWSHYSTDYGTTNSTSLATFLTKVYYYLGKPNTGDKQAKDNSVSFKIPVQTLAGGTDNREFTGKGTAIQTLQAITLYPYVQMKYNTTQDSTWKNTYTLSNYLSTIHNTDFVDLAYSKKNTNSLELNSTQWSTHSRSIKAVGKDNALPGGALHNLSTPDENNTQVALRIFQTVTPDTVQPALQSGYDYYNSNAAQARRDDLINQVTESLSNLSVVQYINEGITKDLKQLANGIMLDSEGGQTVFKNTTSRDNKYFFKFAKTQADGGGINIKKSDDTTETIYNISSFTDGTVKIKKDGVDLLILSKTEDINKILSNPELKELDDKTKFFTNFLLAIDRNVGSDKSGQKWYNEAIDSMELHVYTQIFTLGFNEPFSTRSSVLDPKLIGYQASKADLYNYDDENKVRSSVYLTYGKPTNQTQDGVFATWGDDNVNIILPRLPYLFQSKIFYIPNATVQDLN